MYCPICGKENLDNVKFCESCGKALSETILPTPEEPQIEIKEPPVFIPIPQEPEFPSVEEMVSEPEETPQEEEKKSNKGLIITIISLGSALLIAAVFLILFALGVFDKKPTKETFNSFPSIPSAGSEIIVSSSENVYTGAIVPEEENNTASVVETESTGSQEFEVSSSAPAFSVSTPSKQEIIIQNLSTTLYLQNDNGSFSDITNNEAYIFNDIAWEPGLTVCRTFEIKNTGNVVANWQAKFISTTPDSKLLEAINVYINTEDPSDESKYVSLGTLKTVLENDFLASGILRLNSSNSFSIMLKMNETATNEYHDVSADLEFDVLVAKQ